MQQNDNSQKKLSEPAQRDETYHIFINNVDSFNGKYILSSLYKHGFEDVTLPEKQKLDEDGPRENSNVLSDKDDALETNDHEEDMQDEESVTFDQIISAKTPRTHSKYKIYGSLITPSKHKPHGIHEITAESYEQFKSIITDCDCVIYDISLDEYQIPKALTALSIIEQDIERHKGTSSKHLSPSILFILISTCMTWALTSRMDPNDPDPIPFVESDHRRRKPHPNYKEYFDCEREVMQKGRKFRQKLRTMVICSGITYGFEENILAFLFKKAWSNDQYLPIFGNGSNFVPLVHVADLAQVICKLIDMPPLKIQYILAVEQTPTRLKYIVKYISRALGQGKIEYVVPEEAYLYSEMDNSIFDCLTANIVMEPEFLISPLGIAWRSEMNFVENIEKIVEEFKIRRNLEPLKIFLHGPPCAGKTKLANLLCDHYNLHYVSVKSLLNPSESKMFQVNLSVHPIRSTCKAKSKIMFKESDKPNTDNQDIEDLIDSEDIDDFSNLEVQDSEEENYQKTVAEEHKKVMPKDLNQNSRISDDQITVLLRREMLQNHSQNAGFVLDGYPKSFRQTAWLFRNENSGNSLNSDDLSGFTARYDKRLMPNYVIDLEASNEFLLDRISKMPEESIQNTHYTERDMIRRLMAYREYNMGVLGPMSYFRDCEIEIVELDVSEFPSDFECIFSICEKIIGTPRGFGLTQKEMDELEVIDGYQRRLKQEKEELQKQLQIKSEKKHTGEKMMKVLEKYHHQNVRLERILGPKVEKYRKFTAKKILPDIFQALMAVAEKKPKNPLDFLAEYLFKNNPQGRMYDSRYSRNGEGLTECNVSII